MIPSFLGQRVIRAARRDSRPDSVPSPLGVIPSIPGFAGSTHVLPSFVLKDILPFIIRRKCLEILREKRLSPGERQGGETGRERAVFLLRGLPGLIPNAAGTFGIGLCGHGIGFKAGHHDGTLTG
jgi:hypothetical protein